MNLTIHHVSGNVSKMTGGIIFDVQDTSVPSAYDDVVIYGNDVYSVDRSGINFGSFWWCRPEVGRTGDLPYHPWGKVTVRNNTVHDVGGDGIVLQYTDGGIAEYNTIYDVDMRSGLLNNAGLWVWNGNNTTYLAPGSTTDLVEERQSQVESTLDISNNIFVNHGSGGFTWPDSGAGPHTYSSNLLYGNRPASPPANGFGITGDPLLAAQGTGPPGYQLTAGSPAIGAGRPITGNGGRDYFGNPLPSGPCLPGLGAHQFSTE
ncbi:right-handed parallel beta-helix repeat-containing protein [Planotetraspora sp. GP83]|uniref:right-handed parallel beta-helix repeat-containing protein n=1 Tax=Planotetraspora sp. GP83 TaxID=3156264 RepID=UPI0035184447